jgi:hypothetical protein
MHKAMKRKEKKRKQVSFESKEEVRVYSEGGAAFLRPMP